MLNISTAFKQALANDNRNYQNRAVITLTDGTIINVDNQHIMFGGVAVEDAVGDDNSFTALGSAVINSATLTLYNNDESFSDYVFESAAVVIYTGLDVSGGFEEIKKGTFIVDKATYGNATITLNLLDNMSKFDKPYSLSSLTFPTSMRNVISDACTTCGVQLAVNTSIFFPHNDYIIQSAPTNESTTFREVISKCATIAGCFASCNIEGELELKWFDVASLITELEDIDGGEFDSANPYATGDNVDGGTFNPWNTGDVADGGTFTRNNVHYITKLYSQNIAVDDIVITQVKITIATKDSSGNTVNRTYTSGQDGYTIEITNNEFITESTAQTVLNWLATQFIGLTFRPCNITHTDDPSIEAGDVALVWDTKGDEHPILITRTNFNPGRPQTIVCGAESPSKNSSVQFSQTSKAYAELQKQLKDERTTVHQAIDALADKMDKAGGLYSTVVPQTGGGSITYYHNKPELDESDIQIVISDVGITVSNDGGETWYGLTVDGQLIASIMNAIGINFDWGVGGELIIKNGDNETLYVNADTGEVRIVASSFSLTGGDTIQTIAGKTTRTIMDNANAYGLGWKVNYSSFTNSMNGACYYHGYANDGTPANVDGWVYWNGGKVIIPKGRHIWPFNTMPYDTVLYSVYRTSDSLFHDVVWTGTQWEGNEYPNGIIPGTRSAWEWTEETDIILASYLKSSHVAIYGAQLFTPPKKYSELAEKIESELYDEINTFTTQVTGRLDDMQEQLDGVVDTYYYDYKPTIDNEPASEWTTDADKQNHIGDMFYDTSTGKVYRWIGGNTNLIPYPYEGVSQTKDGITWTVNDDMSITANGTATATANSLFQVTSIFYSDLTLEEGTYELTGTPTGGSSTKYGMRIFYWDGSSASSSEYGWDYGNGLTFNVTDSEALTGINCLVMKGTTVNNIKFTPKLMLKFGWVEIPDTEAQQALKLASEAKDTADHKRRVFISTPYPPYDVGDLWMQGASGDIMTCANSRTSDGSYNSSDWRKLNKYTDDSALTTWLTDAYASDKTELQSQIDGKIETWYQSSDPSTAWTTTALKNAHKGDLWYNSSSTGTNAHVTKRWSGTAWVAQDVPKAVFDEIDGKSAIFYGTPSGTYSGVDVGDYLVDSSTGNTYRYASTGWIKMTDYGTAISTAVTNYDSGLDQEKVFNKLTNNGQTQGIYLQDGKLYINATYIQSGTLSADYIKGGTLKLGGQSNGNGNLYVYNSDGSMVVTLTNGGIWATAGTIGGMTLSGSQIYNSAVALRSDGLWLKRDLYDIGCIGTNNMTGYTNQRGLVFDLEANGNYMAWASKTSSSDTSYYIRMLYANKTTNGYTVGRLAFPTDTDFKGYNAYNFWFDPNTGGANGGITGTLSFKALTYIASDLSQMTWHDVKLQFKAGVLISATF